MAADNQLVLEEEERREMKMIKAKKGLIITLFAAMMVFAFGAASVFADTTDAKATWNSDFTQVTVSGCTGDETIYNRTYTDLTKTFNTAVTTGYVSIVVNVPDVDGIDKTVLNQIISGSGYDEDNPATHTKYFDLNYAVFGHMISSSAQTYTTIKGEYANGDYAERTAAGSYANSLIFRAPDYVANKTEAANATVGRGLNTDGLWRGNWTGVVIGDEDYDSTLATEQNFTLSLDVTYDTGATADYYFVGAVPDKPVKVNARPLTPADAEFYFDDVDNVLSNHVGINGGDIYTVYDGTAHTLEATPIDGWTITYKIFNKKTGEWNQALSASVTDANLATGPVQVKATFTKGDTTYADEPILSLNVVPAEQPTFQFMEGNVEDGSTAEAVAGSEYDPWSFVEMVPAKFSNDDIPDFVDVDDAKEFVNAMNKAYKAAAEANEAELLAAFKDVADIDVKTYKNTPDRNTLTLAGKDLTSKEVKALEEKYEALLNNFWADFDNVDSEWIGKDNTAEVELNSTKGFVRDEVLFTQAPDMTYHVKKAKKLKKNKSFTVAAAATSGKAVTYKIDSPSKKITINSTTGKVKVKKGLKKGTYKVRVMAETSIGEGYFADGAWRILTIKIKK